MGGQSGPYGSPGAPGYQTGQRGPMGATGGQSPHGMDQQQSSQGMGQAQTRQKSGQQQGMGQKSRQGLAQQLPDQYKISNWIDKQVKSSGGDRLGTIKELVMDDYGVVRYAVIKSDKLGPEGQDLVAVPMGHFKFPLTREDHLVFDASPAQIEGAPAFSESQWPNMGDPGWSSVVITYWLPPEAGAGEAQSREQRPQGMEQLGQQQDQQREGQQQAMQQGGSAEAVFDPNRDMVYLPKEQTEMFERLDTNNDGAIDKQEAQESDRLSERFDEIDSYSNDRITRSEFAMFELEEGEKTQGKKQQSGEDKGEGSGSTSE